MGEVEIQKIPEELIYEVVDGKPIYYKGYLEYLNDPQKSIREVMGSSLKQSFLITQLIVFLSARINSKYTFLTNEVGLQFSPSSWRAADLAIVEKDKIKTQKNDNKYLEFAPEVVLEIDIKASLDDMTDSYGYFHDKTDQLLEFGVKEVVWVFTKTEKIMVARKDSPWQTFDWDRSFTIMDGIQINLKELSID